MNYENKLNPEQKKAVEFGEDALLIVAGAGTGKTTVITQRIAWLIKDKGLMPDEILALTFTDKAAGEMEERVDKILPLGYTDLWISTFHSFCERILKEHGLEIGLSTEFKLLNPTQSWLMVRQNLDKFNLDYYRPLGNPTKFIHTLVKHFSRCKDELVFPEDYLKYAEKLKLNSDSAEFIKSDDPESTSSEIKRLTELANAYHIYQQLLLDNNALDFGDLINYCLQLFQKRKHILQKYRNQFKYILVDEFQDTNYAQYELIKILAAPKNNITVVGDDDQSIYKFRGASISNILEFKKDFPKSAEVFLNTNYRSQQNILDLSYKFIQLNNPNRLEVKLNNKKTGKSKLTKELKSALKGKGSIEHLHEKTAEDEVAAVINKIQDLYKKGDCQFSDFAILVRANEQANAFTAGLEIAGLPFQFVASKGLYLKPVVMDIVAFLKMLDNYHESPAFYRLLLSPTVNVDPQDLIKLTHLAYKKAWSLYETAKQASAHIRISDKSQLSINNLISLIEKHTAMTKDKSVSQVVLSYLETGGVIKWIDSQEERRKRETFNFLGQFYKRIKDFEKDQDDKTVKAYLGNLDLELESGEQGSLRSMLEEESPDTIKVMTVHSAKGLEFKYVFLINLVDRRFPTTERGEPIELPDELVKEIIPEGDIHLQEERRLFYVGMTRAKEGVFFTSAEDYGGARKKKPSRFLDEIGFGEKKTTAKKEKQETLEKVKQVKIQDSKSIAQENIPTRFSFTQLKAFENCPLQYKYAHILKIPIKGKHTFSFGKTMHSAMQKFYQLIRERSGSQQSDLFTVPKSKSRGPSTSLGTGQKDSSLVTDKNLVKLDELINIYEQTWIDDWYESKAHKEEYYKKGKAILKDFYEKLPDKFTPPKYLEKGFTAKIGEYSVRGVMDRVDVLKDGGIEIIDYKTGKSKTENKLELEDKEQLLIYQIAAIEVLKEKVSKLTFYYLDNNSPASFLGEQKDLDKIKDKIIKEIEEIKKTDFTADPKIADPSLFKCKWCDFKDICQYKVI